MKGVTMAVEKRFFEDLDWAEKHHGELLRKYRELWIAIYNEQVVASGESLAQVKEAAKQRTGRKHIPVYFVDSASTIYAG
jgi:hypothetical protein